MTPAGIEPVTFRFAAQRLNHCAATVLDMAHTLENNLKMKHMKHHNKMLITTNIEIKMQFIYNCT